MSEVPPDLVAHFRRHNRRATFLAIGCLAGSLVSWLLLYFLLVWAELLFLTTVQGLDAPSEVYVKTHFLILAAVLLVIGSLVREWKTQDEKIHLGKVFLTLLSLPARLTFATWDNFFARVHPSEDELVDAWLMLDLLREEKKVAVTNLSIHLSSRKNADRVVYLLTITELLDTDSYGGVYYHHLRNAEANRLVRRWGRSLLTDNQTIAEE